MSNRLADMLQEIIEEETEVQVEEGLVDALNINDVLGERGSRYGKFSEHALITQNIKRAMRHSKNWHGLPDDMKEALEMVAHKVGRILNGKFDYKDSWTDCVGYFKLIDDNLKG